MRYLIKFFFHSFLTLGKVSPWDFSWGDDPQKINFDLFSTGLIFLPNDSKFSLSPVLRLNCFTEVNWCRMSVLYSGSQRWVVGDQQNIQNWKHYYTTLKQVSATQKCVANHLLRKSSPEKWNAVKNGYNAQLVPAIFVRYNRVNLCSKMTHLPLKSVRYNQVFVNNQVLYNRVPLYVYLFFNSIGLFGLLI